MSVHAPARRPRTCHDGRRTPCAGAPAPAQPDLLDTRPPAPRTTRLRDLDPAACAVALCLVGMPALLVAAQAVRALAGLL